ncbi:MAG: AmmeMemoRadiSam system radical SAM enzyme [Candidatus Bathyarchaeota archaeon]|nr:AmmeMemoRadiSam system radical SAM enzyme [Candidatus Bathyarchaeota archaeon]
MLKEAMLYEELSENKVKCNLCGRRCTIPDGKVGFCLVRKNESGKLYSLVYAKACSVCVDPIGKKPLSHFHPGALVMSLATVGCNFRCRFCDNWVISQEKEIKGSDFPPEKVVEATKENGCHGISYTYTEPTIFFEYAYDTAILAHREGIFNTFVTNGYMTPEAVRAIAPYLDAATVDFKGAGAPEFYKEFCGVPSVEPIYEALKEMKKEGIHVEITNLVVPKIGDSLDRIRELAEWVRDNLGEDTAFHLLRFHPNYQTTDIPSTSRKTLEEACDVAKEVGLHYVYMGNVPGHRCENTFCPGCGELLVKRFSFDVVKWSLTEDMRCPECGETIAIEGEFHPGGYSYPYTIV